MAFYDKFRFLTNKYDIYETIAERSAPKFSFILWNGVKMKTEINKYDKTEMKSWVTFSRVDVWEFPNLDDILDFFKDISK